jgi:outer membrane usher protein FimD/PapC
MEWMNPHARFYVDVKDADGKVTNWNFELGAIPVLLKQGWRKDSLKQGDQITVEGSMAKDGSKSANARSVVLSDGRRVFAGSSGGNTPANQ